MTTNHNYETMINYLQIQLDEGDEITITDSSQPNRLRVRSCNIPHNET